MARHIMQLHGNDLEEVSVGFYGQNNIAGKLSLPQGTFISCDTILNKSELAGLLPAECANPVVEMETAAIARVATLHGIPFLALRTISDPWDEELDFSIDEFCDDSMQIRIPKVLRTIAKRPHIIPQLIRPGQKQPDCRQITEQNHGTTAETNLTSYARHNNAPPGSSRRGA
jgi:adenosylhomocysteine nucleosidase